MKKSLLLLFLLSIGAMVYAQTGSTPSITLTTSKTDAMELKFGCKEAHTIFIDWGNGTPVETIQIADSATVYPKATSAAIYPTSVVGTPLDGGEIKIYADDILFFVVDSEQGITELDVSKAARLHYLKVNKNLLEKLDLSKNNQLEYVNLDDNKLSTLTLGNAPVLSQLLASGMSIAKINLKGCPEIVNVNLADNKITTIDVSANTKMTTLTLTGNLLTGIDCSKCASLKYMRVSGNRLSLANSVIFPEPSSLSQVQLKDNYFKMSTLPVTKVTYTYVPQNPYPSPKEIALGGTVDLSSENNLQGLSTKKETTTYRWVKKTSGEVLVAGEDYTVVSDGVFKFDKVQSDDIYCVMSTAAFPKFTTTNAYKTFVAGITDKPTVTLTTTKTTDVSLLLGCSDGRKVFVDWGDGVPVETVEIADSLAVFGQATMKPTTITHAPKGSTIKVYANDILYFGADEQEVTALNVSDATRLGVLKVPSNSLEELNLANNKELYYVYAEENKLSALDVTKAPFLILLTAQKNQISSIDLTQNPNLGTLTLSNNNLTTLDLSKCPNAGVCRVTDNQLTEILLPDNGSNPTMLDIKNNRMKISALPKKTTGMSSDSRYTYVPQAPYALPKDIEAGTKIDLSSELKAYGVSAKEETTTYTWRLLGSGTALQKDVDYKEDKGVFTFTGTALSDSVYCVMATAAFPKFTSTNIFKTTNVKIGVPAGIDDKSVDGKIITAGAGVIKVLNGEAGDTVEVYGLNGSLLLTRKISSAVENIGILPGSYIVKIGNIHRPVLVR